MQNCDRWNPVKEYFFLISFIIIIDKTALFDSWPSLEESSRFVYKSSVFHLFGFRNSNFFTWQVLQLCLQLTNLENQVPVFMSASDMAAQLYPQAQGSLYVAFCHSQGYGGAILTHLYKGNW
jgi:hypothetical protein